MTPATAPTPGTLVLLPGGALGRVAGPVDTEAGVRMVFCERWHPEHGWRGECSFAVLSLGRDASVEVHPDYRDVVDGRAIVALVQRRAVLSLFRVLDARAYLDTLPADAPDRRHAERTVVATEADWKARSEGDREAAIEAVRGMLASLDAPAPSAPSLDAHHARLIADGHCMDRDTRCDWEGCPQTRDGEPGRSGRSCPRWVATRARLDPEGEGRAWDQG